MRFPFLISAALWLAAPLLLAQDATAPTAGGDTAKVVVVEARITTTGPGKGVVVDRGSTDAIAIGDRVRFFPRGGGNFDGSVIEVRDRTAIVELDKKAAAAQPGTRAEIRIPESRLKPETTPEETADEKAPEEAQPEHPPWENKDDGYSRGQPLLTEVRPVRPKDRERQLTGRAYLLAEINDTADEYVNSFLRVGTDLVYENPFSRGGWLRFNAEAAYLTAWDDFDLEWSLLVRRLSYGWGGTRFEAQRWEVGRFLQHGMPEFGVLDGAEWNMRLDNGHRYGFSGGFMPSFDEDFESFDDFQLAGFYEYVSDASEKLVLRGAFQKTWHNWSADRDLLIASMRWHPKKGWDFDATVWIDFYTADDELKNSAVEVSYALVSLRHRWRAGHGFNLTYRHQTFPQIDRFEFAPVEPDQLANDAYDRLGLDAWAWVARKVRVHGHASVYTDEDETGGAADFGLEWNDLIIHRSRLDVVIYGARAQFEDLLGLRATWSKFHDKGSFDIMWEGSQRVLRGFDDDVDDLVQQRVRLGGTFYLDTTWDISYYAEGRLWDDEFSWAIGFNLQKRF